ncbi:MAG: ketoacyl-ACP synthase III [bacterium]|nr:ketoacyl-ACP synthase III [bacterium]
MNPIARIVSTGHCVPDNVLTNADLEKIMETSDEWITARTGIKQRYIAPDGVINSDLSAEASRIALAEAGVEPEEVDAIILGTVTGDVHFPATACYVQEKIGAVNATAFDISAACSGFIYGLNIATGYIASGMFKNILVIGAETLSRIVNWKDRSTCVLFGDGAGAALIQPSDNDKGILSAYQKSDGRLAHLLMNPGHYTGKDYINSNDEKIEPYIHMVGREVFKRAVRCMSEAVNNVLEKAGVTEDDITLFIPHQANVRIIELVFEKKKIPMDKVYVNVDRYGNTSAASIPIALDEARRNGRLKDGDLCVLTVFGGGFTWAAALVRF